MATGNGEPLPTRFPGQLELRGSDVRVWDGSVTVPHRDGLYLNRWRVYDPRVGQYLQPDPAAIWSAGTPDHPLSYSGASPVDTIDPLGLNRFRRLFAYIVGLGGRGDGWVEEGVAFSRREAVEAGRSGQDLLLPGRRSAACEVAREIGGGRPPTHHPPHTSAGDGAMSHYHPAAPYDYIHVFYDLFGPFVPIFGDPRDFFESAEGVSGGGT